EIPAESRRIIEVPVCYGGEFGPDLEHCAKLEGTTPEEIIRKHSQHDHYVYMLGFAPGQPYSARFEEPYGFKRRETARISVPARSVVVQQNLSDLLPFDQPCGWNVIGRTPCEVCDYMRQDPFLVHPGDLIRHRPVSPEEYREIRRQVEAGAWKPAFIK
ncbi:MAG: carboxyltransferase domain-containing protein, partial [Firmicutes bacterium]|nr:carboxyltransferase domain-containing protein [Bacillota bacterium]